MSQEGKTVRNLKGKIEKFVPKVEKVAGKLYGLGEEMMEIGTANYLAKDEAFASALRAVGQVLIQAGLKVREINGDFAALVPQEEAAPKKGKKGK